MIIKDRFALRIGLFLIKREFIGGGVSPPQWRNFHDKFLFDNQKRGYVSPFAYKIKFLISLQRVEE